MAAGQGFKTFITGEVLTAGDVNGYLMQGINVFASTAARDAAITVPAEGQFAFTKDTNGLWYYDGAAWVASGATGDIEGVTAGVGISGGGTSGTVTITNSMATAIDAKGDLVAGTGADAFSRLAVGANNTVLTADSAQATGLKWATVAGGPTGWSLLNAGGTAMTGAATITVSGISAKQILVLIKDATNTATFPRISVRPNNLSTAIYNSFGVRNTAQSSYVQTNNNYDASFGTNTGITVGFNSGPGNGVGGYAFIDTCDQTGTKFFQAAGSGNGSSADFRQYTTGGTAAVAAAITSIAVNCDAGTFNGGTLYVYGAN